MPLIALKRVSQNVQKRDFYITEIRFSARSLFIDYLKKKKLTSQEKVYQCRYALSPTFYSNKITVPFSGHGTI